MKQKFFRNFFRSEVSILTSDVIWEQKDEGRDKNTMKTYKLFRVKNNKLYPLYVEAKRELPIGEWLNAQVGEKKDETHVKASGCGGKLSLRPGFHSTDVPFTDWIGKMEEDGTLSQRPDTVWAECEVEGEQLTVTDRNGSRELLNGWYYFKTNSKQVRPWIISNRIKINRILERSEVEAICEQFGLKAQRVSA